MRIILAIALSFLAVQPAAACGGITSPVIVTIGGSTIDLLKVREGKRLKGVTVVSIVKSEPQGRESAASLITLKRRGEARTFRLAYPPVTRGCNQPYLG